MKRIRNRSKLALSRANLFADWELYIPRIEYIWRDTASQYWEPTRCSNPSPAPIYYTGNSTGTLAHIPAAWFNGITIFDKEGGSHKILKPHSNWPENAVGAAPHLSTKSLWKVTCLPVGAEGREFFQAVQTDGTTYVFDREIHRRVTKLSGPGDYVTVSIYPSKIEDVHGNEISFTYGEFGPTSIQSNDGRLINIQYDSSGKIDQVTVNGRIWSYEYDESKGFLTKVVRPDQTNWKFDNFDSLEWAMDMRQDLLDCTVLEHSGVDTPEDGPENLVMTNPSGAVLEFEFEATMNGRTRAEGINSANPDYWFTNRCRRTGTHNQSYFVSLAVKNRIEDLKTGGIYTTSYDYEEDVGSFGFLNVGYTTNGEPSTLKDVKSRSVFHPDGSKTEYDVYRRHNASREGQVVEQRLFNQASDTVPIEIIKEEYDVTAAIVVGHGILASPHLNYTNMFDVNSVRPFFTKTIEESSITRGSEVFTVNYAYNHDYSSPLFSNEKPIRVETSASDGSSSQLIEHSYIHDKSNWILYLTDQQTQNGKVFVDLDYDSNGQNPGLPVYQKRFGEIWKSLTWYLDGSLATVTDAASNTIILSDYKRGIARHITLPNTQTIQKEVDDNGWIMSITNPRNYKTSYQYNDAGWLKRIIPSKSNGAAADTIIEYAFSPSADEPTELTQTITQDKLKVTRQLDGRWRTYHEERKDTSNSLFSHVATRYDFKDRVVYQSLPSSSDVVALAGNIPDIAGVETKYDGLGRVKETIADLSATEQAITKFEYLSGNRIQVTDAEDNITTTTFRTYGAPINGIPDEGSKTILPIFVDAPVGVDLKLEYDIWGNKRFERLVNPNNVNEYLSTTEYSYNARNLLQWMKDPAGDTNYTWYDNKDRPIVTQDGEGRRTRTVYDELDRPFKLIKAWVGDNAGNGQLDCVAMREAYDPVNYLQQCYQTNTYDANGNLETITDAKGNTTSYTYDALDRGKRVTYPDNSYTEVQNYDVFGNPLKARTRAGQIHDFAFDALSRMVASSTPDRDSAYQYDAADRRLCGAVYNAGQLGDLNIANDHCTNDNTGLQHRTSYAYDVAGRMTTETSLMAGGASLGVGYQYDKLNNRTRITWPDSYFVDYKYDELSRLYDVMENGSARLAHYDYDDQSRLDCIINGGGTDCTSPTVSSSKFGWQIDSDLASLKHIFANDNDVEFGYDYDKSAKLIMEKVATGSADWLHMPTQARNDNYGAANELNQYEAVDGVSVSHDLNGNRTEYDGLATPHDSENRLMSAGGATYKYDADGRRVAKVSSTTQRFVHAGDMEIAEYDGSSLLRRYIPGHSVDQRVAMIENNGSNTKHFYHANRLGSVQALVNASGGVSDKYVYTPFGIEEPLSESGNPFRYTGRKYDVESNLYYYRARYYDPEMGRFLETDPVGYADQMNMYAYTYNDPLNYTDPTGMCPFCTHELQKNIITASQIEQIQNDRKFVKNAVVYAGADVAVSGGVNGFDFSPSAQIAMDDQGDVSGLQLATTISDAQEGGQMTNWNSTTKGPALAMGANLGMINGGLNDAEGTVQTSTIDILFVGVSVFSPNESSNIANQLVDVINGVPGAGIEIGIGIGAQITSGEMTTSSVGRIERQEGDTGEGQLRGLTDLSKFNDFDKTPYTDDP